MQELKLEMKHQTHSIVHVAPRKTQVRGGKLKPIKPTTSQPPDSNNLTRLNTNTSKMGNKTSKTPKHRGTEKEGFLRPALRAGYYGFFPDSFSLHFLGRSQDQKADYYIIGVDRDGPVQPVNAVTIYRGAVKHQVTLHAGPNHSDAPLGLAGAEKLLRSMSLVALPGDGSVNEILQLSPQKSIRHDNFDFGLVVNGQRENFEWRSDNLMKSPAEKLYERTLVWIKAGSGTEEVVGRWTDDKAPEKSAKLGTFQFEGAGCTEHLGAHWRLAVVLTLLRISQIKWEAGSAADKMLGAAARVTLLG
jgi:hypothetical protein